MDNRDENQALIRRRIAAIQTVQLGIERNINKLLEAKQVAESPYTDQVEQLKNELEAFGRNLDRGNLPEKLKQLGELENTYLETERLIEQELKVALRTLHLTDDQKRRDIFDRIKKQYKVNADFLKTKEGKPVITEEGTKYRLPHTANVQFEKIIRSLNGLEGSALDSALLYTQALIDKSKGEIIRLKDALKKTQKTKSLPTMDQIVVPLDDIEESPRKFLDMHKANEKMIADAEKQRLIDIGTNADPNYADQKHPQRVEEIRETKRSTTVPLYDNVTFNDGKIEDTHFAGKKKLLKAMESLHKEDNFNRYISAAEFVRDHMERYSKMTEISTKDREAWQKTITMAKMIRESLENYLLYLDTITINEDVRTKLMAQVEKALLVIANALTNYSLPSNRIGTSSSYSVIVDIGVDENIDEVLNTYHTNQDTRNIVKAKSEDPYLTGITTVSSEAKDHINTTEDFDGKRKVRVNYNSFTGKDKTAVNVSSDQRYIGPRFYSKFNYTSAQLANLSEKDLFVLAIREADTYLYALKDRSQRLMVSGDLPREFAQYIVDYLAIHGVNCKDNIAQYVPTEGSAKDTESKLVKYSKEIFGEAESLRVSARKATAAREEFGLSDKDIQNYEQQTQSRPPI